MNAKLVAITLVLGSLLLSQRSFAANLVTNGSFEQTSSGFGPGNKVDFPSAGVTDWNGGANLTFLDAPGTADDGDYLSVYGPFPAISPDGGNFVEADADPNFSGSISQTINGLTVGQTYAVSFYQAAGQQQGFTGDTFEGWQVTLGSQTQNSAIFNIPSGGLAPWEAQSLTFTADGSSDLLTFLAVGGPFTTSLPPISFLDGVSITATSAPLPTGLSLGFVAMIGLLAVRSVRRSKNVIA